MLFILACGTGCPGDDVPSVTTTGADSTTGDDPTTGVTLPTTTNPTDPQDSSGDDPDTTAGDTTTDDPTMGDATEGDTEGDTTSGDLCGNGEIDDGEDCDGDNLGDATCEDQGFLGGDLACADDCSFDTAACTEATCGDDTIEGDEVCDGIDLAGEDCVSQGMDDGVLACAADCTGYDLSGCIMFSCGNDMVEGRELCDGTDLAGQDCASQGFDGGEISCADSCMEFDTSGCFVCGDDTVNGAETCDGADLNGQDCILQGFDGGTLGCNADCGGYDTSGCFTCGDDTINGAETCDGADLGGQDCVSQGFGGGTLACNDDCGGFDTSACTDAVCGNDIIDGTDVCDGADLGGEDCISQGFAGGTLACAADCSGLDTSGCNSCGNGILDPGEACEPGDLGGEDCTTQGFLGGTLGCNADCTAIDTNSCYDAQTTVCSEPGVDIGPGPADPLAVDVLNIAGGGAALVDVDVLVDASHTWSADMEIDITHVASGTVVRTFDNDCGNDDNMLVTFDDSAPGPIDCGPPVGNGGTAPPFEPLSGFAGLGDGGGDWQITIGDTVGGDGGTLNQWCVTVNTNSTAPFCGDGSIDPPELCEGTDGIAGNRCEDFGFAGGPLNCAATCGDYDVSECSNDLVVGCVSPGTLITTGAPFGSTVTVPPGTTVGDLDVFVDITHTWDSDLDITLTHEDTGTTVDITLDQCGGDDDVYAVFNDEAAGPASCNEPVGIEGNITAGGLLSDFDGVLADGNWTLNVTDDAGGDDGTLNEWCVYITPAAP